MKKIKVSFIVLICIFSVSSSFAYYTTMSEEKKPYLSPQQGDIRIEIEPNKKFIIIGDEISFLGKILNLSQKSLCLNVFDPGTLRMQFHIFDSNGDKLVKRSIREVTILESGSDLSEYENVEIDIDFASAAIFCNPLIDNKDKIYHEVFGLGYWYIFPDNMKGTYRIQALNPITEKGEFYNQGMVDFDPENPPGGYIYSNTATFHILDEAEFCNGQVEFNPHKWNMQWRESEPEGLVNCWIGNIEGHSVKDIDTNEIYLNGYVRPVYSKIIKKHKGFDGKVLHLKFKQKEVIWALGKLFWDKAVKATMTNINVQGKMTDGKVFESETEVQILNPQHGRSE